MKKRMVLIVCMVMLGGIVIFGRNFLSVAEKNNDSTGVLNPFTDCAGLCEAEKIADFKACIPDVIEGYTQETIEAVEKEMIQVIFRKETSSEELFIRKALGSEDVSGDYNSYPERNRVSVDGLKVTTKGEKGKVYVAVWENNGYTYAITANTGISKENVIELIKNIK